MNKGNSNIPTTWVLQHKSAKERFNSTSGCLYPEIARYFLEHGGYVAGHIFNEDYTVRGYVSNKIEDLELLRNSKYLQSDMQGVYKQVKRLLVNGKQVLFSGCPCQVAAFKTFLSKDYPNLLTADFTCMGIDSPKAFLKYIESLEHRYGSKVAYFKSKSKETGWRDLTNKFVFENGKTYFGVNGRDANLKATFLDVLVRPSCFDCKFKGLPRIADITIGDFWRQPSKEFEHIDDNTGTSYYIANNEKAIAFFEKIKESFRTAQVTIDTIIEGNGKFNASLDPPLVDRAKFYKDLNTRDFQELVDDNYNQAHPKRFFIPFVYNCLRALKRLNLNPFKFVNFLYNNTLNSNVEANIAHGDLLILKDNAILHFAKGAKVKVKGLCQLGSGSCIEVQSDAKLSIDSLDATAGMLSIIVEKDANLHIGYRTSFGKNVAITCSKNIKIGSFSFISNNVVITDSNDRVVCNNDDAMLSEPITIGEHCLFGQNVVVKRGAQIGDEVIVEPNSTVSGCIPPRVKIAGTSATIIEKDILWKR